MTKDGAAPAAVYPAEAAADEADLEAGRLLFAKECRFVAGAAAIAALPPATLPETALIGRSNVGKSSLLNALTGRTALARVSRSPGRTRQINFFLLGERLMLADLPGYGFAQAPKQEIASWSELIAHYLQTRPSLRRILLLVDARHGIKPADRPMMQRLDRAAVSFQLVLTKTDALAPDAAAAILEAAAAELKTHSAAHPVIHLTSARTGSGIAALRASLGALAAAPPAR